MSEEDTKTNTEDQVKTDEVDDQSKPASGTDTAKKDPAQEGAKGASKPDEPDKPKQTREEDAAQAAARKKREADEEKAAIEKAKIDGKLSIIKENPYTKTPITDEHDLKVYEQMAALDKQGKDPIKDLPMFLAEEERQSSLKSQKYDEEAKQFVANNPNVDVKALVNDPDFEALTKEKDGKWTLQEMYDFYLAKKNAKEADEKAKKEADEIVQKKLKDEEAKKALENGSTPSAIPGGTRVQKPVSEMTDEEFLEYRKENYGN